MKKIWNSVVRPAKNAAYQKKALKQFEKIASGEVHFAAPKHETEKRYFEVAQKDEKIKADLEAKHEELIEQVNKINIKSSEIKEHYPTSRELPTRDSEWLHRNDQTWEYGFYEPPTEKISNGKLTFREALEVLHARLKVFGSPEIPRATVLEAQKTLEEHPAIKRVGEESIEKMWQYFRPFERRDTQKVVRISELAALQQALQNGVEEESFLEGFEVGFTKLLNRNSAEKESYDKLDNNERRAFLKEMMYRRVEEQKRLTERLAEIKSDEADATDVKETEKAPSAATGNEEKTGVEKTEKP